MSTHTLIRPEQETQTGSGQPKVAHIVDQRRFDLTEAYVLGNEVEALCGHRWIPTRSPAGLPVCQACKEIAERAGAEYAS